MVSYWRSQWGRLLMALLCLVMCIVIACVTPTSVSTTEELTDLVGKLFAFSAWFIASILWLLMSVICYNDESNERRTAEVYERLKERVDALSALIGVEKEYSKYLDQKIKMLAEELAHRS